MTDVLGRAIASANINIHMANMLHGEQYIEIMKPFPTSGLYQFNTLSLYYPYSNTLSPYIHTFCYAVVSILTGTLTHKATVRDVLDKKSGAVILFEGT